VLAATALVAVALGAGLGGGGAARKAANYQPASAAHGRRLPGRVTWIISGDGLRALRSDNAGLARRFFDNPATFVIGKAGDQDMVPRGYRSIATMGYTSLAGFEEEVHQGTIDRRIGAVLYDPERWEQTPAAEQSSPIASMHRFVALARRWGYGSIVAPGRDLALGSVDGCQKRGGELLDAAFLRCRLPTGSRGAEAFVLQGAAEELDPGRLRDLLRETHLRLAAVDGGVLAITTISTSPPASGTEVWPIDLVRAARMAARTSPGLMLNLTPGTVGLAASFLRDLERDGPIGGLRVSSR
jgi:hypothetical protein